MSLNLLIYAAIGIGAFANPEGFASAVNLGFLAPAAVPEFLATFGGFMLAIAAALLIALRIRLHRRVAFASMVLAYAGFAGGRLYGMLLISGFDWRNGVFFALEVLLLIWGFLCYRETKWLPLEHGH
ncbi:hypothetical protein [Microbulbifer magnicolonia]|uniref:hypothetical protein n=1 Tax=Microbulbifer magnicolonia TaxID=3109744 RepID=UPI002B407399|nr:hypothetical protein [Microbulbifer sp. GG15]